MDNVKEEEPKKNKGGRPFKGTEKKKPIKRQSTRKKRVLKLSKEDRIKDTITSLNKRFGSDLSVEVIMSDEYTLPFLRELTIKSHLNSTIFFSDVDNNKATEMQRQIYNLPNTENRVMHLNPHSIGMGFGEVMVFGTKESSIKMQDVLRFKLDYDWKENYQDIIVLEDF